MKKIMIAMGAIMSLALGAFAVDVTSGTLKNAVMFDGITTGTQITSGLKDKEYPYAVENTAYYGDGGVHWECAGSTEDSIITNLTGDAVDNFLQIDQTDTLYRWMNQTTETSTNEVSAKQGIYFASKVQFTASDETNGVNLVSDASDKLLIWLRAADLDGDDEVDGTNLIITASANYPGGTKTDFVIDNYNVVPGEWYQLLVKSEYQTVSGGTPGLAFTVKIGAQGDSEAALTTLETSAGVSKFYSMDANGSADDMTIAKVGFKGTGAADDIEFGTYAIAGDTYFRANGIDYESFADAVTAAQGSDGVVTLTKNFVATETLSIAAGNVVILDLAGNVLSAEAVAVIQNAGTLTITNSTATVGSVRTDGVGIAAIVNDNVLTIVGGKFYGDGTEYDGDGNEIGTGVAIDNDYGQGTTTVYDISSGSMKGSNLVKVTDSGSADYGYWVIEEAGSSTTEVTAYLSLDPASATYNENKQTPADYTTVTVVFSNATEQVTLNLGTDYTITWSADTVTNATSDYVCTVAAAGTDYTFETVTATLEMFQYVPTWEVTFSTNGTLVAEYTTNVVDQQSLAADQIPAFTGGEWEVDPTNAVITCATNFNYTISGSNWPAAWSDDSAYADDYTDELTTWMSNNNISSMDTLTVADETAFLLNIAPDAEDKTIDATAITIDGTTVKITVDQKLASANGVVYLMYGPTPALGSVKAITFVDGNGVTPSSMTTLEGETATAQFYKVGVGFAVPVTAEP